MTTMKEITVKVRRRRRRRHHRNKNKLPVEPVKVPEENVTTLENEKEQQITKTLHEEKIFNYYKTLTNVNKAAIPVKTIEEIGVGDVIYFRKIVLKRRRPKLSAFKKAKVFFKMRREQDTTMSTEGPNAILFRCFEKFNVGWPADWKRNTEEILSSEPFIMNFTDMLEISKESSIL